MTTSLHFSGVNLLDKGDVEWLRRYNGTRFTIKTLGCGSIHVLIVQSKLIVHWLQ